MAASVTLVLTSVLYLCISTYFSLRLSKLWPRRTKAPYSLLLLFGIILQIATYLVIVVNFACLAFLPRRRRIPLLATIAAWLFRFIPLLLILCTVRALHARLSALTAARPAAQEGRFKLARYGNWLQILLLVIAWVFLSVENQTVSDALNGRREQEGSNPLLDQLAELFHAIVFTSLTYMVLVLSRRMNGFLPLPDKVLLALNIRIAPLFLFRSSYTVIDAILPLLHPQIRILTPSLTISVDGFIWLIAFYNLLSLAHPDDNWIDQDSAHLVRGITRIEEGEGEGQSNAAVPGNVDEENGNHPAAQKPSRWSRLLSPLRPHRGHSDYGATHDEGNARTTHASTNHGGEEEVTVSDRQEGPPLRDVAIVHGVAASGTQVYAQTGPMAPAWLVKDVAVNGKAGSEPIQDQRRRFICTHDMHGHFLLV